MTFDPVALLREFGLSAIVVIFIGWLVSSVVKSFVPRVAEALAKRIEAGTKLVEVTTSTVEQLPNVIERSGKETRDVIASYEKAVIASETRVLDAFKSAVMAIKDEIFDAKTDKIARDLDRIGRKSIPDSDPPSAIRQQ